MPSKMTKKELEQRVEQLEQENERLSQLQNQLDQLRQTEAKLKVFQKFTESSGQGLGWGKIDGTVEYFNQALSDIAGEKEREGYKGKSFMDYYSPETQKKLAEEILPEVVAKGQWLGELDMVTVSGEITPTFNNVFIIRDDKDEPLYFCNIVSDITQRRREREALEQEVRDRTKHIARINQDLTQREEQFRGLFDHMGDGAVIYEVKGDGEEFILKNINKAGEKIANISKNLVLNQEARNIFPGILEMGLYETFQRVWKTGEPEHLPPQHFKDDRASGWVENYIFKLPTQELVIIFKDVTRRLEEEEERARLENQLQQSQKMEAVGTLAGGIAHDFNNILGVIMGYLDLSIDDLPDGSIVKENLKSALESAEQARDIVRQILEFSRKQVPNRVNLYVSHILKEELKLIRASIPSTIEIEVDIAPSLSPIYANSTQIQQVLMNICNNAAHAMRINGGVLRIEVKEVEYTESRFTLQPGKYQVITISDTGHGMPPDVVERIFEPYFTTKLTHEGTGMGLAVVHRIIKNHGGDIQVISKVGKGTTFEIFLPIIMVDDKAPVHLEDFVTVPGGDERILVVDDDVNLTRISQLILENLGYKVMVHIDSRKALQTFESNPDAFDMVITDQTMPGLTGLEMAARIYEMRPELPILLCTGYSEHINEENFKAKGIDGFLLKPINRQKLAITVRQLLDDKKA